MRAQTERLAPPLSAEDCALQSMPDASPVKWHLAHTTWFFETFVLKQALPAYRPFAPQFRVLFNSYYVAVGPRHPRPERGLLSRLSLDEVRAYRRHVDGHMTQLLNGSELAPRLLELIELGVNHEQQHQELIVTDFKHLLSRNPLQPAYVERLASPAAGAAPLTWIDLPDGIRQVGFGGASFRFDDEEPRHRVFIDAFTMASRPVTVGEYADFIADGGDSQAALWLSEGWDMRNAHGWTAPLYWQPDGTALTLHGTRGLDASEPVCHLNFSKPMPMRAGRTPDCRRKRNGKPSPHRSRRAAGLRRRVEMDAQFVRALSRLPGGARRGRRIQRGIHVQPIRTARRLLRYVRHAYSRDLPQFLPRRRALAVQRRAPRARNPLGRSGPAAV